jgi:hypothetical protein
VAVKCPRSELFGSEAQRERFIAGSHWITKLIETL